MSGMDRHTGKTIDDIDFIRQSINDILTTPKGSRMLRRNYGTNLFEYIDGKIDSIGITYEVCEAISKFEPRFRVKSVDVLQNGNTINVHIHGIYKSKSETIEVRI